MVHEKTHLAVTVTYEYPQTIITRAKWKRLMLWVQCTDPYIPKRFSRWWRLWDMVGQSLCNISVCHTGGDTQDTERLTLCAEILRGKSGYLSLPLTYAHRSLVASTGNSFRCCHGIPRPAIQIFIHWQIAHWKQTRNLNCWQHATADLGQWSIHMGNKLC